MTLRRVCRLEEVENRADRQFVVVRLDDGSEIGIISLQGRLHAFENRCAHMGGPVCLGDVVGRTEVELGDHRRVVREYVSAEDVRVVCPWHGVEYNIQTGVCPEDPRWRLRKVEVSVVDGDVVAELGEGRRASS